MHGSRPRVSAACALTTWMHSGKSSRARLAVLPLLGLNDLETEQMKQRSSKEKAQGELAVRDQGVSAIGGKWMRHFIDWRDEWLLHIVELDGEHRQLVALLNRIAEVSGAGTGAQCSISEAEMLHWLEQLGEHVRRHFRNEEELMEELDYAGYERHRYEHVTLLAEYADLLREIRRDGVASLDAETLVALKAWLISHIVGEDQKLGAYYREVLGGPASRPRDQFRRRWMRLSLCD
jgi:hemerythrin